MDCDIGLLYPYHPRNLANHFHIESIQHLRQRGVWAKDRGKENEVEERERRGQRRVSFRAREMKRAPNALQVDRGRLSFSVCLSVCLSVPARWKEWIDQIIANSKCPTEWMISLNSEMKRANSILASSEPRETALCVQLNALLVSCTGIRTTSPLQMIGLNRSITDGSALDRSCLHQGKEGWAFVYSSTRVLSHARPPRHVGRVNEWKIGLKQAANGAERRSHRSSRGAVRESRPKRQHRQTGAASASPSSFCDWATTNLTSQSSECDSLSEKREVQMGKEVKGREDQVSRSKKAQGEKGEEEGKRERGTAWHGMEKDGTERRRCPSVIRMRTNKKRSTADQPKGKQKREKEGKETKRKKRKGKESRNKKRREGKDRTLASSRRLFVWPLTESLFRNPPSPCSPYSSPHLSLRDDIVILLFSSIPLLSYSSLFSSLSRSSSSHFPPHTIRIRDDDVAILVQRDPW